MSNLALATILVGAALAASMISIEVGISVALIELGLGVFVGNVFDVTTPDWLVFLASFAGVLLTFLAGAEVDVDQFKREWRASLAIGVASFAAPFVVAMAFAYWGLGWTRDAAEICGLALCRRRASRSSTPCSSRRGRTRPSSGSGSCPRRSSPT
jgi:Kef-type K+ transport system membrane component KefB